MKKVQDNCLRKDYNKSDIMMKIFSTFKNTICYLWETCLLVSSMRLFFLPLYSISRGWERLRKRERERERERDLVMVRWEGRQEMKKFIGRKKWKDECMKRVVGFSNGLDGDRSKAQKYLNGFGDVIRAQYERIVGIIVQLRLNKSGPQRIACLGLRSNSRL